MDIQCDSEFIVPQEHVDAAIKFGVELTDGTDVKSYIMGFMRKLLLQTVKVDQNVLESYLSPAVVKQWQELLSSLEERNRKLIDIRNGSLVFTLFCPTRESRLQLQDQGWRIEIQKKMREMLKLLGK